MKSFKIYIVVVLLTILVSFLNHFISKDPIDWSSTPKILKKPKDV